MESEEVNSENLPVEMYFKNIEEIIKEEKLDSEEEKEVQIKKEPAEINPIEFCDINMDTEEEENEYEEEMKESLEKNSSLCKEKFDAKLAEAEKGKAANSSSLLPREEYDHILNRLIELAQPEVKKTQKDYRLLRKYEILEITVEGTLVQKLKKKGTDLRFVCAEDLFDVIHAAHLANGHRGRTVLFKATGGRYANITKAQIMLYLQFCEECQLKKSSIRKSLVVKPIISNSIISRCQVDLIDMQSQRDGEYCFILNYQDHLTKMVCLRALKTKTAEEVAYHLVDIFCDKGAPHILQSANGREFANKSRTANGNADNLNCEQSYSWNKEQSSSYHNNANYDPKKMVKCNECNNLFTKNYFKVHILNHSKEIFKCSQCNYTTNRKERLKLHELNHLETKTFKCGECSYATNIQKYFKEHVKIHLDKKVFNCSKCDYQTNIKKYLREHIMIHTEKKLFKCSKCYYETNRKDRLRIHEQNHSELKRFQCGHCDFGTNIKRVLKDHELTHLEATMFHCAQCEYTTNFKSSLTRHTHSHFKKK